jgi:hypothetical protein
MLSAKCFYEIQWRASGASENDWKALTQRGDYDWHFDTTEQALKAIERHYPGFPVTYADEPLGFPPTREGHDWRILQTAIVKTTAWISG